VRERGSKHVRLDIADRNRRVAPCAGARIETPLHHDAWPRPQGGFGAFPGNPIVRLESTETAVCAGVRGGMSGEHPVMAGRYFPPKHDSAPPAKARGAFSSVGRLILTLGSTSPRRGVIAERIDGCSTERNERHASQTPRRACRQDRQSRRKPHPGIRPSTVQRENAGGG
jgi:hypothetical protein